MRWVTFLFATLLAGCSDPEALPLPASEAMLDVEQLISCYSYVTRAPMPASDAEVPEGFRPIPHTLPDQATWGAFTYGCDATNGTSNGTVIVHLEGVAVEPPAEHALVGAFHVVVVRVVVPEDAQASLFATRGFGNVVTGDVRLGYNMRGPQGHGGGYTIETPDEGAITLAMRGDPAAVVEFVPIRVFAVVEGELVAIGDHVASAGCSWEGVGTLHVGGGIVPFEDPAAARPAEAIHGEHESYAAGYWGVGAARPDLVAPEGVDPASDPAQACVA